MNAHRCRSCVNRTSIFIMSSAVEKASELWLICGRKLFAVILRIIESEQILFMKLFLGTNKTDHLPYDWEVKEQDIRATVWSKINFQGVGKQKSRRSTELVCATRRRGFELGNWWFWPAWYSSFSPEHLAGIAGKFCLAFRQWKYWLERAPTLKCWNNTERKGKQQPLLTWRALKKPCVLQGLETNDPRLATSRRLTGEIQLEPAGGVSKLCYVAFLRTYES